MEAPVYRGLLLTEYFLVDGILDSAPWKAPEGEDYAAFSAALPALVGTRAEKARLNEANTKAQVIIPLLDLLGWKGAQHYEGRSQSGVLDILLMRDAGEWGDDASARAAAVTFLEAKKWGLPLDRREGTSEAPSTQMLRYLTNAAASPGDGMRWGILTNGRHWRLYWQGARSRSEEFFELDLRRIARGECENPEHWRRVFYLMFSRPAFLPVPELDRRTFHAHAVNEGRLWEARITEELSAELLDESLPELARAVAKEMSGERTDPGFFERLRDAVTTILFRLLFVLYAEDRGLLPMGNRSYRCESLSEMRDDIAERMDTGMEFSTAMRRCSSEFSNLCLAIGRGDRTMGLPPYNGKLFAENGAAERVDIPDAVFARLVDKLSRRTAGGKKRRINYRDLSVRHLGAIYERLLLHEFADHPQGGVQARLSPQVRKLGGSYYTPDELTELVIRRTLDPLLAEKKRAWDKALQRNAPESETRKLDPAEAALNLKICDPAMGSGHFLAAVVDHIADRALEYMAEADEKERPSPLTAEVESARVRIVRNAKRRKIELPEHLDDRLLVRRLALKRAVYGVDKNPWAAELAKLSLWLHTFTAGAPLSFLDHHLRTGDSLFGEWIESGFRQMEKWGGALFTREFLDSAREAAALMAAVEARPDADVMEVRGSAQDYRKFTETNRKLENLLRLIHSLRWMDAEESNLPRKERERRGNDRRAALVHLFGNGWGGPAKVLEDWALPKSKRGPSADIMRETLDRAAELDRREGFLHWESAFPGVWPLKNGEQWEGGFDAIVGNPPWERIKMQEVEWFRDRAPDISSVKPAARRRSEIERRRAQGDYWVGLYDIAAQNAEAMMKTARACGEYPAMSRGDANLYALFVERSLRLIRPTGMSGLLVPSAVYSGDTTSRFFKGVAGDGRIAALLDFKNRPASGGAKHFRDVHPDFRFSAFVLGGEKAKIGRAKIAFMLDRPADADGPGRAVELSPKDFDLVNPTTGNSPIFRTHRDARIVLGVYRDFPILYDEWRMRQLRMIDPDKDSGVFQTAKNLTKAGHFRAAGNVYRGGREKDAQPHLPLYIGRMMTHFNHRANSVGFNPKSPFRFNVSRPTVLDQLRDPAFLPEPPYWIPESSAAFPEGMDWAVGRRDVTGEGNERTVIAAIVPHAAYASTLPLILPEVPKRPNSGENSGAMRKWRRERESALANYRAAAPMYAANLCSFALDYVCRQKVQGAHLSLFALKQLPVIPTSAYSRKFGAKTAADIMRDHVLRLTYVSEDMLPFARDMGFKGKPFVWDEDDRAHLRARLDALYFHLYGIGEDDAEYIMSTFPIVERKDMEAHGFFRTRDLILEYMRALESGDSETRIVLPPSMEKKESAPRRSAGKPRRKRESGGKQRG